MAEFVANAIQNVGVNQNVVFTDTIVDGCDIIYHRNDSGIIRLFGLPNRRNTRFKVTFGGNMAVPTDETVGEVSAALSIDGEPVQSTTMTITPAAVNEYFNVSSSVYVYVRHGCCATIGVENISTIPISVRNANIIVTLD